jgi:hypothetical protein
MKAMIRERKLELQAAEMVVAAVAAILEAGDTQEVAATRVAGGTLAEDTQAAVVIQAVAVILGAVGTQEAAATPAAVTRTGDLTMATGTPVTTKRYRN